MSGPFEICISTHIVLSMWYCVSCQLLLSSTILLVANVTYSSNDRHAGCVRACLAIAFCHLLECAHVAVTVLCFSVRCARDYGTVRGPGVCGRSGMRGLSSSIAVSLRGCFASGGGGLLQLVGLCDGGLDNLLLFVIQVLGDINVEIWLLLLTHCDC